MLRNCFIIQCVCLFNKRFWVVNNVDVLQRLVFCLGKVNPVGSVVVRHCVCDLV